MVLAVGAGSVFGSHINDSGFWMFKEFFKLSLKQTFLSWTVMESVISVLGLIGVLLLQTFLITSRRQSFVTCLKANQSRAALY